MSEEDLARFHRLTMGHAVIMGRRTFDIIGHPLAGRANIVVTRDLSFAVDGVTVAHSLEEALRVSDDLERDEVFVIGGGQVFAEALPLADKLYLTLIEGEFEADVFFPPYSGFTKVVFREEHTSGPYCFIYVDLERQGKMMTDETSNGMTDAERMKYLRRAIADLKARVPKHSVPAAMMVGLEDLQEELRRLEEMYEV